MVLGFVSSSSIKNKEHQKSLIIIRIGLIFHLSIILIGSEFHDIYMIVKDFKNQDNLFFFNTSIPKICGKNFYLGTLEPY